ncbi:MAG TPA: hypothetical protein VFE36_16140 [Candidatus Baltobacteraceae bacterium]|nr:hypothetical protein [Candidatus Baltobacteraceae bacterium]
MGEKLAFLAALAALGASPGPGAYALAEDAARTLAAGRHGATAFSLAYRYTEHGPAHNVDRSARAVVLRDDGAVLKVRTFGDDSNKPTFVEDDYRLPIETKYLAEYRFAPGSAACDRCPSGAIAVDFTSLERNDEHGDGTMWIDGSSSRFVALHFHPSVLPAHTDSADITVAFGQVLPDLWDVTVTEQQYNGHTFIFHGWGHVQQKQIDYRRYASVGAGLTALSAAEPAPSAATPKKR